MTSWRLDVGCGRRKQPGFIGLDGSRNADCDVIADLGMGLPFRDGVFDEAWMSNVLEHVENPVQVMEELWRVCRDTARLEIRGPHFSSPQLIWGDPTHRRGLSLGTFGYFTGESDWYVTRARFAIASCCLVKGDTSFGDMSRKPWYWLLVLWNKTWEKLINLSPTTISRYERLLSRFIAFQEIRVVLLVEKRGEPKAVDAETRKGSSLS